MALSILMTASLFSCSAKDNGDAPAGMKLASNSEVAEYYLYVPESYIVDITEGLTAVRVSEADSSSVTVSAFTNSSISKTESILLDYWDSYEEALSSLFDKTEDGKSTYTLEKEAEALTLARGESGNVSALKYVYSGKIAGNDLKYMQVIAYHDDYFYVMTFTSTPEGFGKNSSSFDSIITNFKLK